MGALLFWQWNPPDPNIAMTRWRAFLDDMGGALVVFVVLGVVITATCYTVHARAKRIRNPGDVFAKYTPMAWLVLAVVPAVALIVLYWLEFEGRFLDTRVSWGGAVALRLVGGVLTLILSYATMWWSPLITPRKFRYRPRALLSGRRSTR